MSSPKDTWIRLLKTAEGRILVLGLTATLTSLLSLMYSWFWWPDRFQLLVALVATSTLFGRAAGMSFGYAMGLDHGWVVSLTLLVETLFVLIFYPLFVFSWQSLPLPSRLRRGMDATTRAAQRHQHTIQRYGIAGLLAFVWLPFWLTGPVVGSAIGYLLGLRPWVNLSVVLAGTFLAILGYALVLGELHAQAAHYGPWAPMTLVVLLVVLVALMQWLGRRRDGRRAPKCRR